MLSGAVSPDMKGKNRKTTSGLRATRLVTHNPEVIGSSLAPATIKSPLPTRKAAIFSARLQLFWTSPFLDTGVTQTMTQMGQKTRPEAEIPPPDFSAFGEDFFVYSVAVRTLSMVFAASFWAAVVTWA